MSKFVFGLWWLVGGLAAALLLRPALADSTPLEPIPYPIWHSQPVAPSGYAHVLALDSADRPHFLFQDPVTRMLRYTTLAEGGWEFDDIAAIPAIHPDLTFDMALAAGDVPCLAYANAPPVSTDPIDTRLVYGCRIAGEWQLTPIDDGGRTVKLALDGDTPHIALVQEQAAVYLTREDGQWLREIVGEDAAYMGQTVLYLDAFGRPHVVFAGSEGTFEGAREPDGSWTVTPFAAPGVLNLALDAAHRPWLLLTQAEAQWGHPPFSLNRLLLAEPDGSGGWAAELLREDYDWPIAAGLAIEGIDSAGVAYRDVNGELRYQRRDGDQPWQLETPPGHADADVRLAFGSDGQPRLSYGDAGQLWLATREIVLLDEGLYLPMLASP